LAEKALTVRCDELGFIADDLLQTLHRLDKEGMELRQFIGLAYGSGFEAQPHLLQKIAELIPVIGNTSVSLAAVKNASIFFATMQKLNIKHPRTFDQLPANVDLSLYVQKFSGGCGGVHIKPAQSIQNHLSENHYFQNVMEGLPVSLLFITNGNEVEVVGFNEQWLSVNAQTPFRYGGAVSHADLSVSVKQQLLSAAQQLTVAFGLVGLNSLDAIVQIASQKVKSAEEKCPEVQSAEHVYVLEVNPRLSATVDLYANEEKALFYRHVEACLSKQLIGAIGYKSQEIVSSISKAHAVVYADIDVTLMLGIDWPSWVTDTPIQLDRPLKIMAGAPICSVIAYADSADAAKKEVLTRVQQIKNLLQSSH